MLVSHRSRINRRYITGPSALGEEFCACFVDVDHLGHLSTPIPAYFGSTRDSPFPGEVRFGPFLKRASSCRGVLGREVHRLRMRFGIESLLVREIKAAV